MKLIVGLGNPGRAYTNSRHNAGFLAVKALSGIYKTRFKKEKGISALSCRFSFFGPVILAMPLTFMNLSGSAVSALVKKYKVEQDNLLVICDDLDLELGRIKIRPFGSSGGQKGLQSVISCLGRANFSRLRIGINRPLGYSDAANYVLSSFSLKEKAKLKEVLDKSCDCVRVWLSGGINKAMNEFNINTRS